MYSSFFIFTLAFFFNDIFFLYHCFYWRKWSHPQIFLHFWAVMILGVWGHLLMLLTLYFLKLLYVASYCGSCHFNKLLMLFCCFHNFSSFFFFFFWNLKIFKAFFCLSGVWTLADECFLTSFEFSQYLRIWEPNSELAQFFLIA